MSEPASPPDMQRPAPTLGALIRDLRQASGWSRRKMEKYTGVAQIELSRVETGRALPSSAMLRKLLTSPALSDLPALAERLGLTLDLVERDKDREAPK